MIFIYVYYQQLNKRIAQNKDNTVISLESEENGSL